MNDVRTHRTPGPDHPITLEVSSSHVVVRSGSVVIAETSRALEMREASYPAVMYVPIDDVDQHLLRRREHHTWCPYKGEASYYDVIDGDGTDLTAVAWYYDDPFPAVVDIKGRVAFYTDRVTVTSTSGGVAAAHWIPTPYESAPTDRMEDEMTTTAVSTTKTLNVTGIGPVDLTVEERGEGSPFLVLHGGAGPQSVGAFAQRLAEEGRNRVFTPTHPGFGGTPRPDALHSVAGLAALYSAWLDDAGLDHVRVIGNSVGGWIAAEMALLGSLSISSIALLDAVGIAVEGHSVADVAGFTVPEIQALSFHDPTPFRVDPATIPDAQKAIMDANGAALAIYAGSTAMADPTLLGRLSGIDVPTLVLWGESDRIVEPAYGQAYAAAIHGARFEVLPATGHMPQMENPDLVLQAIRGSVEAPDEGSNTAS